MKVLTFEETASLGESLKYILTDCDGVLFKGKTVFPLVPKSLSVLRSKGTKVLYITNNSTSSREAYLTKFTHLGLPVTMDTFFSSAYVTALFTAEKVGKGSKVFCVGSQGLMEELRLAGLVVLGGPEYERRDYQCDHFEVDPEVRAVVVGFDRDISYHKFTYAFKCVKEHGAEFIATNTDAQFPLETSLIPGGGCFVAFLAHALGRQPTVVGKPEPPMFQVMSRVTGGIDLDSAIMIGDRMDTDILFGKQAGVKTVLVTTGVHSLRDAMEAPEELQPDYVIEHFEWLAGVRSV